MSNFMRINPESFLTFYLQTEDGEILLTEDGKKIVVTQLIPEEWVAVRVYDYEKQMNENKREIVLIDKRHRNNVVEQFRKSMQNG